MADETQHPAQAANTPETAETPGPVVGGPPPVEDPSVWTPTERVDERTPPVDPNEAQPVPGYPDDLGILGGFDHGGHTFISQSTVDRETQLPVQRTVCAVCGAEVVSL